MRSSISILTVPLLLATLGCGDDPKQSPASQADASSPRDALDGGALRDGGEIRGDAGPSVLVEDYVAGSRLEPHFMSDGKGARIIDGFVDHGRNDVLCTFAEYVEADGASRLACANFHVPTMSFRDANCSEPMVWLEANHQAGEVVAVFEEQGCDAKPHLYVVGEALPPGTHGYSADGTCQDATPPGTPHALAGAASLTGYVTAERVEVVDESDRRLRIPYYMGSDGSRIVSQLLIDKKPCGVRREQEPGAYRCLPYFYSVADGSMFADDGCSEAVAVGGRSCGGGADLVIATSTNTHGKVTRTFFEPGAPVAQVFEKAGAMCRETTPTDTGGATLIGKELPWTSFVAIDVIEEGTGRLRSLHPVTASGRKLPALRYFLDTELGVRCGTEEIGGGRTGDLCVPSPAASADRTYADQDCKVPVGSAWRGTGAQYIYLVDEKNGGPDRLFTAEPYVGALYSYEESLKACVPYEARRNDLEWYRGVKEIALDTLARLTTK